MNRSRACLVAALVTFLLAACVPPVAARGADNRSGAPRAPEVLSPKNHQRIGEGADPACPPAPAACHKIRAEGRVPPGLHPYFGVEPVLESPKIWIQPEIRGIEEDGSFSGLVHLGEEHVGVGEYFKIYVLACKTNKFHNGEEILKVPEECTASAPVEVNRVR